MAWRSTRLLLSVEEEEEEAALALTLAVAAVAAASWNELIESKSLTSEKLFAVAARAADDAACIVACAMIALILALI